MKRTLVGSVTMGLMPVIACVIIACVTSTSPTPPLPTPPPPTPPPAPMICRSHKWTFNAGPGTYSLTLQRFNPGNKRDATLCTEGPVHDCSNKLLTYGQPQWPKGETRSVNISTGEHRLEIWQSEYDDGRAAGGSEAACQDGDKVSMIVFQAPPNFSAVFDVAKR